MATLAEAVRVLQGRDDAEERRIKGKSEDFQQDYGIPDEPTEQGIEEDPVSEAAVTGLAVGGAAGALSSGAKSLAKSYFTKTLKANGPPSAGKPGVEDDEAAPLLDYKAMGAMQPTSTKTDATTGMQPRPGIRIRKGS